LKRRWIWIVAAVILLAVIVGASIRGSGPKGEKVYAEKVQRRDIEAIVAAPGEIDPKLKVNISANVIGKIERLYFKEGDLVKRGQRLVDLERANYAAQRDRISAELSNRRIELQRARLNLANSEAQLRRARQLQKQGIQAEEAFDRSKLEFENGRAAVLSAQQGVRQAEASLAQSSDDLSRTSILSPIDGKVVQLNAQEGEVVVTGTMNNIGSVIAIIADLSQILVQAEVTETEVVRLVAGQKAKVRVDAVADVEYQGTVSEIGSSAVTKASAGVRVFNVKILFDQPDQRLRPGMTAQVDIVTERAVQALSVPVQSVVERDPAKLKRVASASEDSGDDVQMKKYVMTVVAGAIHMVEVTSGISNATHVAILSGLKGDEQIVTGPFRTLKKLREGSKIVVEKEKKKVSKDDEKDSSEKGEDD